MKTFIATASVLEGVGVSAYLGAAADIMSKSYLTAAGSILTVEARHSSYIRSKLKQAPFAAPFDTPLTLDEVYTLAAGFITSCPETNAKLPLKAFPALQLDPAAGTVKAGSKVKLLTPGYTLKAVQGVAMVYAAFISVTGPTFVVATPVDGGFEVTIPKGFSGQSYAVLTSCNETVTDDTTAAGPVIIEVCLILGVVVERDANLFGRSVINNRTFWRWSLVWRMEFVAALSSQINGCILGDNIAAYNEQLN